MRSNNIVVVVVVLLVMTLPFSSAGTSYIYANKQLMGQVTFDKPQFYQLDYNKNVRSIFDDSGALVDIKDFSPFGESTMFDRTIAYASRLREMRTGLYNTYNPSIGRSLSPHTVTFDFQMNPQGMNVYAMPFNNPFRSTFQQAIAPDIAIPEAPAGASGAKFGGSVSGAASVVGLIMATAPQAIEEAQSKAQAQFMDNVNLAITAISMARQGIKELKAAPAPEYKKVEVLEAEFNFGEEGGRLELPIIGSSAGAALSESDIGFIAPKGSNFYQELRKIKVFVGDKEIGNLDFDDGVWYPLVHPNQMITLKLPDSFSKTDVMWRVTPWTK